MFCEKKNLSVRRKKISKCGEGGEKNVSVEFRVFGKKRIEREVPRKKNQSVSGGDLKWRILLSSCSLVGLYVRLQVKVAEKKWWKFSKYFSGGCLKLKLRFAEKDKVKKKCWGRGCLS